MNETKNADQDFLLWQLMFNVSSMMSKVRTNELRKYHISTNTAAVLDCVYSFDNSAIPSQIAKWLIKAPQSVSGILNRMEKRGMIQKSVDPKRKNVVRVNLTKIGEQTYKNVLKRKAIHVIFSSLSEEEKQQLWKVLEKVQVVVTSKLK